MREFTFQVDNGIVANPFPWHFLMCSSCCESLSSFFGWAGVAWRVWDIDLSIALQARRSRQTRELHNGLVVVVVYLLPYLGRSTSIFGGRGVSVGWRGPIMVGVQDYRLEYPVLRRVGFGVHFIYISLGGEKMVQDVSRPKQANSSIWSPERVSNAFRQHYEGCGQTSRPAHQSRTLLWRDSSAADSNLSISRQRAAQYGNDHLSKRGGHCRKTA